MKNLFLILILGFLYQGCGVFENEQDLDKSDVEYVWLPNCDYAYIVAEQMPVLQGGLAALQATVEFPPSAYEAGKEGRVTVRFYVNAKGSVVGPEVIRGVETSVDQAALEAVAKAVFTPGEINRKPVCVQYSVPIIFRIPD